MREKENLTLLGNQQTEYRMDYDPSVLEAFQNKHPENDYFVKFNCPEFTSLCPKTGQPDFGTIHIKYVPARLCIELKSLKLYIYSYRSVGTFHEHVTNKILDDIVSACSPLRAKVTGDFNVRGGIKTVVTASYERD